MSASRKKLTRARTKLKRARRREATLRAIGVTKLVDNFSEHLSPADRDRFVRLRRELSLLEQVKQKRPLSTIERIRHDRARKQIVKLSIDLVASFQPVSSDPREPEDHEKPLMADAEIVEEGVVASGHGR